ncbi:hypothetical protein [Vibrio phage BUCT194]|uniref:Uncharacterized protein n=1 Tax=Vibrio phage BUCT194 TaxID=2859072 RepID=A0AAE9BPV4_9CAUD|nr:hypothetical protein PP741_gp001 [Vibrio phage BUCT194]UAW01108.1 hypothetical protein [Vibrio phage BUCT194]
MFRPINYKEKPLIRGESLTTIKSVVNYTISSPSIRWVEFEPCAATVIVLRLRF